MSEPVCDPIGRAPDHEFGFDPERPATVSIERGGYADADAQVAQSIVALVKTGSTLTAAAREIGQPLDTLYHNHKARAALARLKADYELTAEELKSLVKTTAVELAIEGEGKERLDAIKLIAQMPDVGLSGVSNKLNLAVGVFSDETKKVLASIDPNEKE